MNDKIDVTKTAEIILSIKKADSSLNDIVYVIKHQALPVAHRLSQEYLDTQQKLFKSFSALIATCINQHLRFMKLISMLGKRTKKEKILKTLDKTNRKGDKLIAELRMTKNKLDDYIRITKKRQWSTDIDTGYESCVTMLAKTIAEFTANTQHINKLFAIEEEK